MGERERGVMTWSLRVTSRNQTGNSFDDADTCLSALGKTVVCIKALT